MLPEPIPPQRYSRWPILVVPVLALVGLVLWRLPAGDDLIALVTVLQGYGWVGTVGFGMLYVVACVCFVPVTVLTLAAGFAYGPWVGFLTAWTAEVIGALISYFLARTLLRKPVAAWVATRPRLAALDRAFDHDDGRLLLLVRMSPISPFAAINYALGLTGMRPVPYVFATAVGTMPLCMAYAYAGSGFEHLGLVLDGEAAAGSGLYWAGLAVTVVGATVLSAVARRALLEAAEG